MHCDHNCFQIPKYSQSDLMRLQKEWELEFQARLLAKEREWSEKSDELKRNLGVKYQHVEEEKVDLVNNIQRLQKSHEDMK